MKKIIGVALILLFAGVMVAIAQPAEIGPPEDVPANQDSEQEKVEALDQMPNEQKTKLRNRLGEVLNKLEDKGVQAIGLQQVYNRLGGGQEGELCNQFEDDFEYEDTGKDVEALQDHLVEEDYLEEVTGTYDWSTARALHDFQKDNDISPDPLVEKVGFRFGEEAREYFNDQYDCPEEEEEEEEEEDEDEEEEEEEEEDEDDEEEEEEEEEEDEEDEE